MFPKKRIILLLIPLLLGTACSHSSERQESETWFIFSAQQAKEINLTAELGHPDDYWTPTENDVLALETGLIPYLKEHSNLFHNPSQPVWGHLDQYHRQYLGYSSEGREFIYANYFCNTHGVDWKEEFIFVMDGGECYFQIKYDPASGEFFDLTINGEA